MRDQFVTYLLEELLHAIPFNVLERHPVNARGTVVLLGHQVGFVERFHLADMDVQTPETPRPHCDRAVVEQAAIRLPS